MNTQLGRRLSRAILAATLLLVAPSAQVSAQPTLFSHHNGATVNRIILK